MGMKTHLILKLTLTVIILTISHRALAIEGIEQDCGRLEYHVDLGEDASLDLEDLNDATSGLVCKLVKAYDQKLITSKSQYNATDCKAYADKLVQYLQSHSDLNRGDISFFRDHLGKWTNLHVRKLQAQLRQKTKTQKMTGAANGPVPEMYTGQADGSVPEMYTGQVNGSVPEMHPGSSNDAVSGSVPEM